MESGFVQRLIDYDIDSSFTNNAFMAVFALVDNNYLDLNVPKTDNMDEEGRKAAVVSLLCGWLKATQQHFLCNTSNASELYSTEHKERCSNLRKEFIARQKEQASAKDATTWLSTKGGAVPREQQIHACLKVFQEPLDMSIKTELPKALPYHETFASQRDMFSAFLATDELKAAAQQIIDDTKAQNTTKTDGEDGDTCASCH